jgi:CheY-like chemotaxis protein
MRQPVRIAGGVPADGEGLELIEEIRRHPEWRSVPLIALAEGELSRDEVERLRGQVRRIVWSETDVPNELTAELRRIAAGRAVPANPAKTPKAAAASEPAAAVDP